MRRLSLMLIFLAAARSAIACECTFGTHQSLLDRAQFVGEVTAQKDGLVVDRVIRGDQSAKGKTFRSNLTAVPPSCCDHIPVPVVAGEKYWLLGPERELDIRDAWLLTRRDGRIEYLSHVRDITPSQLRDALMRWRSGEFSPAEFSRYIDQVDLPSVESCSLRYYHRFLTDVVMMAWSNADHFQCDPAAAARARTDSADSALSTLSFVENESRAGRLMCAKNGESVTFIPDLVERQFQAMELYPCMNAHKLTKGESAVVDTVLGAWFNEVHGTNSFDRAQLYYRTLRPEVSQMKVRVFSPANDQPSRDYATADARLLIDDLLVRSTRIAKTETPSHFQSTGVRLAGCDKPRADVVAVSRPGINNDRAIVYLESMGGARAYHLVRTGGQWSVDWYVDLWQCG